jgi:hypothetical protein
MNKQIKNNFIKCIRVFKTYITVFIALKPNCPLPFLILYQTSTSVIQQHSTTIAHLCAPDPSQPQRPGVADHPARVLLRVQLQVHPAERARDHQQLHRRAAEGPQSQVHSGRLCAIKVEIGFF